jgi:hypothetical protein
MHADGPVAARPRAAVNVDERRQRRGRLTAGPLDACEQFLTIDTRERNVALLDFVWRRLIEPDAHI